MLETDARIWLVLHTCKNQIAARCCYRLYSWTSSMQLPCHGMVQYPLAVVIWCMIVQYIAVFSWSLALLLKMGWNQFWFFSIPILLLYANSIQRVFFLWPQLLLCKRQTYCVTMQYCFFPVGPYNNYFYTLLFWSWSSYSSILVNLCFQFLTNRLWFFLIKLLHLQIYF